MTALEKAEWISPQTIDTGWMVRISSSLGTFTGFTSFILVQGTKRDLQIPKEVEERSDGRKQLLNPGEKNIKWI